MTSNKIVKLKAYLSQYDCAIITGASSGIGRQCAIDCSKMGAKVILVARNEERLKETLSLLEGTGHCWYKFDLGNLDEIGTLVEHIREAGSLDGFVHAAGIEKTLPMKSSFSNTAGNLWRIKNEPSWQKSTWCLL